MRYAIISDVHANEAALRAVLTDAADAQAEKIICLGDVLGYGPDPVAALELVYRRAHVCLIFFLWGLNMGKGTTALES